MFNPGVAIQMVAMMLGGRRSFKDRVPPKGRFHGQSAEAKELAIVKAKIRRERRDLKRLSIVNCGGYAASGI